MFITMTELSWGIEIPYFKTERDPSNVISSAQLANYEYTFQVNMLSTLLGTVEMAETFSSSHSLPAIQLRLVPESADYIIGNSIHNYREVTMLIDILVYFSLQVNSITAKHLT